MNLGQIVQRFREVAAEELRKSQGGPAPANTNRASGPALANTSQASGPAVPPSPVTPGGASWRPDRGVYPGADEGAEEETETQLQKRQREQREERSLNRQGLPASHGRGPVQKSPEEEKQEEFTANRPRRTEGILRAVGSDEPIETRELTEKEFNALSPRQQAAVRYNTLLVGAVERDKAANEAGAYVEAPDYYNEIVEELFGEDRGSDLFAPETVNLLRQFDFSDKASDLDDFLDLKVAITDDDLVNFDKANFNPAEQLFNTEAFDTEQWYNRPLHPEGNIDMDRYALQNAMVVKTEELQASLEKSRRIIDGFSNVAETEVRRTVGEVGGYAPGGFLDKNFRGTMQILSNRELLEDRDEILESLRAEIGNPDEADRFLPWAELNSRTDEDFYEMIDAPEGFNGLTREEFRKHLGFDK